MTQVSKKSEFFFATALLALSMYLVSRKQLSEIKADDLLPYLSPQYNLDVSGATADFLLSVEAIHVLRHSAILRGDLTSDGLTAIALTGDGRARLHKLWNGGPARVGEILVSWAERIELGGIYKLSASQSEEVLSLTQLLRII